MNFTDKLITLTKGVSEIEDYEDYAVVQATVKALDIAKTGLKNMAATKDCAGPDGFYGEWAQKILLEIEKIAEKAIL